MSTQIHLAKSSPRLIDFVPAELQKLSDLNLEIPNLAKHRKSLESLAEATARIPTQHLLRLGDARDLSLIETNSVHLVLTSPPYWTLKAYEAHHDQMGSIENYERFLMELDRVWAECLRVLTPGGRLIVVVGDVCLSRRQNQGRHTVVPLHSSIQENCRKIGFDNLAPIIWHKIANAKYEVEGNGAGFLGKPYEPNAVIKNDIEYILMERKSGGYRAPDYAARLLSVISEENYRTWFQQIWEGITGASTKEHPAPFPIELADRLIRMFSFVGDIVLDPFLGSGTTSVAAAKAGRNSIGFELIPTYLRRAAERVHRECDSLFGGTQIEVLD